MQPINSDQSRTPAQETTIQESTSTQTRPIPADIHWREGDLLLIFLVSFIFAVACSALASALHLPYVLSSVIMALVGTGAGVGSAYWLRLRRQNWAAISTQSTSTPAGIHWRGRDILLVFLVSFLVSLIFSIVDAVLASVLQLPDALSNALMALMGAVAVVGSLYLLARERQSLSSIQREVWSQATPSATLHWRWRDLLLIFLASLLFEAAFSSLSHALQFSDAFSHVISRLVSAGAVVGGVYWWGVRRQRQNWMVIGFICTSWRWLWGAVGLGLLLNTLQALIGYSIRVLLKPSQVVNPQQDILVPRGLSWVSIICTILVIGVVIPFAEELLFRGVLYRFLRERWGIGVGVLVSAVVFGISHGDLSVALGAGLFGLVSALLYERTKSLWPSIIMHIVMNSLTELIVVSTLLAAQTKIPLL